MYGIYSFADAAMLYCISQASKPEMSVSADFWAACKVAWSVCPRIWPDSAALDCQAGLQPDFPQAAEQGQRLQDRHLASRPDFFRSIYSPNEWAWLSMNKERSRVQTGEFFSPPSLVSL